MQQTQPQSHWRWINSAANASTAGQTTVSIPSIISSPIVTSIMTPTRPNSSSTTSSRDSTALAVPSSLASDRFGNAFPYLKPSAATNPFHSLFGLSNFHSRQQSIARDYPSVPTLCSCTSIASIPVLPHRPTASLPHIAQTNPLEFSTQSKCDSKDSPKN